MLQIVADENIPGLDELFAAHGRITKVPGRGMQAALVQNADALIVRSVTQVSAELLAGSAVSFVGTCTIGTDHLDTAYLQQQGIRWTSAPGCNARGVVDYVLSALLSLSERSGRSLLELSVAVIGVGQVGQRLVNLLQGLGINVRLCDPPRAALEKGFQSEPLTKLLAECDVITLHTPLTEQGDFSTQYLLNQDNLPLLKPGAWLINASRGGVVDNQALAKFLLQRPDVLTAFDVWEHEPAVNAELVKRCHLATPHIAGYSLDGKLRGTEMVYQAFCQHFKILQPQQLTYPPQPIAGLNLGVVDNPWQMFKQVCRVVYDIRNDDAAFRLSLQAAQPELAFDQLRKHYTERRELTGLQVNNTRNTQELAAYLAAAGVQV